VQDYGAPVGYRIASRHPDRVTAIVVQNGNAYDEGLDNDFWKPLKAYWQEPTSPEKRNALRAFLNVEANGVGISPELLSRMFDLFAQADQSLARSEGGLGWVALS
jgi:signal transduction histidine kinase